MTLEAQQELLALVSAEQLRVKKTFPFEGRLAVMELARAMDHFWVSRRTDQDSSDVEMFRTARLMTFGINTALQTFLDESCGDPEFPLARSTEEWQTWADSVIQHCGRLGICKHILDLCRIGLGEISKSGANEFRFRIIAGPAGIERFDREDFFWLRDFIASNQAPQIKELESIKKLVWNMMATRVKPWEIHYIQYDAHPIIDSFYEKLGGLHAQLMTGQDSFPSNTAFGNHDFNFYRAVVGVLVGWSFKHLRFCIELLKKYPNLDPRNLLTVPQHLEMKARYLASAFEIDEASAQDALNVLTLDRNNIRIHCASAGDWVAAPLIGVGQGRVLSTVWGSQSHPFRFLLTELRNRYRSDWDKGVDARESVFRQELYSLFPQPHLTKFDHNVKLRVQGKVITDIDALIFDRATGLIGLFQLKWQDAFGNNMLERESRKSNLLATANTWIDRVSLWLSGQNLADAAQTLGLTKANSVQVTGFRLFVIARNAAHFSGTGEIAQQAAWGMWVQVLRLFDTTYQYGDPIQWLFTSLIADSPFKKTPPQADAEELTIGSTRIYIEHGF